MVLHDGLAEVLQAAATMDMLNNKEWTLLLVHLGTPYTSVDGILSEARIKSAQLLESALNNMLMVDVLRKCVTTHQKT